MSEEERILRLENAMATLAELAAEQHRLSREQQRQAAEQQRLMSEQQRIAGDQQRRVARLEESFVILVQLTQSHDESIDELKAARAESERKQAELSDTMKELAVAMAELAQAQAHADRRVDALVDIMRDWRNGRS